MSDRATDAVVVAVARTPFGRFEGGLKNIVAPRLGALAINEALSRASLAPDQVDAVYSGVGMMASALLTPVRQAVLFFKPSGDHAFCIHRSCLLLGNDGDRAGDEGHTLRRGKGADLWRVRVLSNTPILWPRQRGRRIGDVSATDPLLMRGLIVERPIPVYSGDEAMRHGVDRREQDEWAHRSHQRYFAADRREYFEFERFPVETGGGKGVPSQRVTADESPRSDTNLEKLSALAPVYGGKTVTAGNAPGLNDGAAFLVVTRRDFAEDRGLQPLARLIDYVQICGGPTSGTSTPAAAISRIAARNDRDRTDWDLLEINEAYAATPLVSTLVLADGDRTKTEQIRERTNIHGGAVAIGHPLGASGARIVMTLINGLRARGGGRGAAAICGGFGQGDALMVEVA